MLPDPNLAKSAPPRNERGRERPQKALPERVRQIMLEAAEDHGITPDDMMSGQIANGVARARQDAMARVRRAIVIQGKPATYPQIGRWFGRDHSTVMFACRIFGA